MKDANKPIKQFRLGRIVAGIFRNEHEGSTYYNVAITRLYKPDGDEGDWARTHSFGRDDLPRVAKVADQAWTWIHERQQEAA